MTSHDLPNNQPTDFVSSLPPELLQSVFDSLGDIVFCTKDRKGCYQSVNQAFVDQVQVESKGDLIGRSAADFFPEELAKVFQSQDEMVFESGQPLQDQLEQIVNRDGSLGWFLASKFPIHDTGGTVVGLIGISQNLHTPSDSDLALSDLRTVIEHIRGHLDQSLRVDKLATMASLSTEQLDRRMKRVFRLSTKKYIMKCRLEKAATLLSSADVPLSEIALRCGFSDQSAFTRQFRTAFNIPPLTYRKRQG